MGDSEGTDLTGDAVVEEGSDLWRPAKKGQVGILFRCSILEGQLGTGQAVVHWVIFWFPAIETEETVGTSDLIVLITRRIKESRFRHLQLARHTNRRILPFSI